MEPTLPADYALDKDAWVIAEIRRVTKKSGLAKWCPNCQQKGLPTPQNGTLCKFCFEPVNEKWREVWDE